MTNVTNISIATRDKAVVAAIRADRSLADKACLAVDLLTDTSLANVPAAGILAMLRNASPDQAQAAASRYAGPAAISIADPAAGWAKAAAAANARFGL